MITRIIIAVRCLLPAAYCLLPAAHAEDWPQFRGPHGDGHSAEHGLPMTWSEREKIAWKVPIPGRGWSSPVVVGNQIWLTTALEGGRSLRALCLDCATGQILSNVEVFQLENPGRIHQKNSHASPTPIIDSGQVFVHFGSHGTACLSTAGMVLWKTVLKYYHRHGPGGSPALAGNSLIISCDGYDEQYVVALDKATGKIRWKRPRKGRHAYSTPTVLQVNGAVQVISTGGDRAVAYDPQAGAEIWSVRYKGYSLVPRPLFGHGLVFICTGFDPPATLLAVRPTGAGDVTETHLAWSTNRAVPLSPSPILVGAELYFVSDTGIASCLDAQTGKMHWTKRLDGSFSASPVCADGRIYLLNEAGLTTVIEAGTRFKALATNQLDGQTLASMAVARGAIYLRTDTHLYRIEERSK